MTYPEILSEIQRRAGFEALGEAERSCFVVLGVLGRRLLPEEAAAVAGVLPDALARCVVSAGYEGAFDVHEFYERVARGEGVSRSFGAEHAQAVCQVLGEAMPEGTRVRLQKHLGAGLAPLFEPRAAPLPPPRPVHGAPPVDPGRGTTLATGMPGSRHPLSEGRPESAHSQSMAKSDDPHADTKLSSSQGLTQERFEESLATGKPPGPVHPVSDTRR
jgi:uncharacterized protein (DUF2267 family)